MIVDGGTGKVEGLEKHGILQFRGIPYARADRFRPSQPVEGWTGVRDAT
ncbi:MAG: carboxylesterase family protein, partial [Acidimicrobiales bacterium]